MRLEVLDRGHRLRARVIMRLAPLLFGTPLDDVGRTSLYRPELFGRAWLALLRDVMVAPSEWSRGDRELLAAFVSNRNRCRYCAGIHAQTATLLGGREITANVLADWRSADFDERITAAFVLLEATAGADASHADAIAAARSAGLSDAAIIDVLAVGFVFDLVNRLADAFFRQRGPPPRRGPGARPDRLQGPELLPRLNDTPLDQVTSREREVLALDVASVMPKAQTIVPCSGDCRQSGQV